jgi:hypothetical protein
MKKLSAFLFIGTLISSMFAFTSCEKKGIDNTVTGTAEFSVTMPGAKGAKSASADSIALTYQLLISVVDMSGNAVFTDKLIPLYVFGTGFVSENVEIKAGSYKLTKFMVINTSGAVIYASPVDGSPLAYLTTKPLPIPFTILADQVTKVVPEVLLVGDNTPDKFGYASFGVSVITPLDFYAVCVLDPGVLMPPISMTTATVTIFAPDGWHYKFKLEAAVNHLIIRGGYNTYTLLLEKEGYQSQTITLNAEVIKSSTKENPFVFNIPWSSQYRSITIQPGPEKGKDAMVSNLNPDKNFGDYKYFETTFLSESVLTVMRSNRSLIAFNLDTIPKSATIQKVTLVLAYDLPIPFDSTYYFMNTSPVAGAVWYGAVLQQIVEPWDEFKVTWNTQPKTIETNQVYLAPFIRNTNVIGIDVTKLFVSTSTTDVAYPNYGMLFRLWPVDRFPGFRFASSDYPEAGMRPKLTVFYSLP